MTEFRGQEGISPQARSIEELTAIAIDLADNPTSTSLTKELFPGVTDVKLLQGTIGYADQLLAGRRRNSGDPYLVHSLAVGSLVHDLAVGSGDITRVVISGIHHDSIEEGSFGGQRLKTLVGEERLSFVRRARAALDEHLPTYDIGRAAVLTMEVPSQFLPPPPENESTAFVEVIGLYRQLMRQPSSLGVVEIADRMFDIGELGYLMKKDPASRHAALVNKFGKCEFAVSCMAGLFPHGVLRKAKSEFLSLLSLQQSKFGVDQVSSENRAGEYHQFLDQYRREIDAGIDRYHQVMGI